MNLADQLREYGGPTSLSITAIPDGTLLSRSGTTLTGISVDDLAVEIGDIIDGSPVFVSEDYSWNSGAKTVVASAITAPLNITLPSAAEVDLWAPGEVRDLLCISPLTHGVNLIAPASTRINYAVAGTDMSPIPGTDVAASITVLGQAFRIARGDVPSSEFFSIFGVTP